MVTDVKTMAEIINENFDFELSGNRLLGRSRLASPPIRNRRGSSGRRQGYPHNGTLGGMSWKQIWIIIGLALLMLGLVLAPILFST